MTAPLSPEEAATVERFDAAEAAPESLREQVARTIYRQLGEGDICPWEDARDVERLECYGLADAAIAVIRGDS